MSKLIDLTGKIFHRLTVLYREGHNTVGRFTWKCRCECGKETYATSNQLKTNRKKSCGCARKLLPPGEGNFNWKYKQYKYQAKSRNLEFEISKEDFRVLTSSNCIYCGHSPSSVSKYKGCNGAYIYNGIDRINSNLGYILGNIVSCCEQCNVAKNKYSQREFYEWIDRVYNNIHKNSITMNISMDITGDETALWRQNRVANIEGRME